MTYCPNIAKIAEECFTEYALDFPVSQKTTYKIGGNADGALFPDTAKETARTCLYPTRAFGARWSVRKG